MSIHSQVFAAAEAIETALPIRPMSGSGRANLRSSGSRETCVLGRAEIGKHGQPRWPEAHGPDATGNPAKLGAPIERVEGPRQGRKATRALDARRQEKTPNSEFKSGKFNR